MLNERPTPETDQFKVKFKTVCGEKYWVPLELSERLELELNEARKELEEYRSIAENIGAVKAVSEKEKAIRERNEAQNKMADALQEKYDSLAVENMLDVNKICNQRDAAMDVLEEISLYLSSGIGDENTTAQQYKDRILDGIKHLAGHAWEERCKYEKLWKKAEDALMKIEEIFVDGENTHDDWFKMGSIAREYFKQ